MFVENNNSPIIYYQREREPEPMAFKEQKAYHQSRTPMSPHSRPSLVRGPAGAGAGPRPTRPRTATDYIPLPAYETVPHDDVLINLLNGEQITSPIKAHKVHRMKPIPQRRNHSSFEAGRGKGGLVLLSQQAPLLPVSPAAKSTMTGRGSYFTQASSASTGRSSVLDATRKKISELGKTALEKAKPVCKAVASRLASTLATDTTDVKGLSRSSSSESLFHRRRLPKLRIPEPIAAVDRALHSACSTDTQDSPSFALFELSPTSRDLKREWWCCVAARDSPSSPSSSSTPEAAEYHNMFSARRRVRKGKFGSEVTRFQQARPTWDDHWVCRGTNDNLEDRALLGALTTALQEQKDLAAQMVRRAPPGKYPGLEMVRDPGCTMKLYWQHKSSYR